MPSYPCPLPLLPIPDNPDPDLVRRTRQGDRDAFLALVERHAPAVRSIVAARIPGSEHVERETVAAFERIHRTLFVVRDLTWFHLFAVRTAQAHLDARGLKPDNPCPDAPTWFAKLPLVQREAALFAEHAARRSPFPAIEYLGITQEAYEARGERARLQQAKAQEWGPAELPPAPPESLPHDIARLVDTALGEAKPAAERTRQMRRMPLALSFLLAVGLAGMLVALLFRPPAAGARRASPVLATPIVIEGRGTHDLPGGVVDLDRGSLVGQEAGPDAFLRLEGAATLFIDRPGVVIGLRDRSFVPGPGVFRLEAGPGGCLVLPVTGSGRMLEGDAARSVRDETRW